MFKSIRTLFLLSTLVLAACQPAGLDGGMAMSDRSMHDDNIVLGIISAPAVSNGIVADQPIGINILLNAPGVDDRYYADPAHFGHQIPAGGWMEIELGGSYIRNGVDNDEEFVPVDSNLNLILLSGNPQNAIVEAAGPGPQHGNYTVEDDGNRTFTVWPNGGEGANGLEGARAAEIGVKVIHILPVRITDNGPTPFLNGPAGTTGSVTIHIYNPDGSVLEQGEASVEFKANVGPQVFPINFGLVTPMQFGSDVVTELVEATNFQRVSPGTQLINTQMGDTFSAGAPYAPRFLLMAAMEEQPDSYGPMVGIPNAGIVVDATTPSVAMLVQDSNADGALDATDAVVGQVSITGPSDSSSGQIIAASDAPLTVSGDGAEGPPGSFFTVPVELGAEIGIYEVTVSLDGGGSATIFLVAK